MRCKGGYARLILFRSSGDHGWKGRGHVRVENSQPPQSDQSFHVTRHARVHRPRPRWCLYANRVPACVHVLGYAARGGRAQLLSAVQWPQLWVVSGPVFWGTVSSMRGHILRLVYFMSTLQVAKLEAVVGNPCLAKRPRRVVNIKDAATGVERKVTVDGGDTGSFGACNRVVQLLLAKDAYVVSSLGMLNSEGCACILESTPFSTEQYPVKRERSWAQEVLSNLCQPSFRFRRFT